MDPKLGDKSQPPLEDERQQIGEETPEIEKDAQLSTLSDLLSGCHLFSLAICIEEPDLNPRYGQKNQKLLSKRFPARVIPWHDFPDLQEKIWEGINAEPTFASQPLFAPKRQLNSVSSLLDSISCLTDLEKFEQLTVGNFVENIVGKINENEPLRKQLRLPGKELLHKDKNTAPGGTVNPDGEIRGTSSTPSSADQFCVNAAWHEQRRPIYVVEFKPPYELTLAELSSGLKEMEIARDVINREERSSFEHHSQHLVAAIIIHLYDYMINTGVRYGYLYTGEAYLFLCIMNDPSAVQYFLSVPSIDVNEEEAHHPHRTAVAQVLTFTLNALAADPPSQDWYEAIAKRPKWEVEYLNVLQTVPDSIRQDPPSYECKPSSWQSTNRSHSESPLCESHSQTPGEHSILSKSSEAPNGRGTAPRQFCTIKCIHGLAKGGFLDRNCPNVLEHGAIEHQLTAPSFTDKLHKQLLQSQEKDFEQLDMYGGIGFLLKASLSTFGYTVLIKATSADFSARIQYERKIYKILHLTQGKHIPTCLGFFEPKVPYFYHGKVMTHMLVLGWAGDSVPPPQSISEEKLMDQKRAELSSALNYCGLEHRDMAWRNMLWNGELRKLFAINLEDVQSLSK